MRDLPEDNLSYPVLIQLSDGSSGSGFFVNYKDRGFFFVTASHVLFKKENGKHVLRSKSATLLLYADVVRDKAPILLKISDLEQVLILRDLKADIAVIKVAKCTPVKQGAGKLEWKAGVQKITPGNIVSVASASLKKFDDVIVSNEVFVLGYPNSLSVPGASQIDYTRPLLRKGIIAGKNDKNKTIILDCPVYFGNSGGLAIEVTQETLTTRQFRIIGVVSQYVPFVEQLKSLQLGYINRSYENSGYSVVAPSDTILRLLEKASKSKSGSKQTASKSAAV